MIPPISEPVVLPRFGVPASERMDYGYTSPSRRVTWSDFLDDEAPKEWCNLTGTPCTAPRATVVSDGGQRRAPLLVTILPQLARSAWGWILQLKPRASGSVKGESKSKFTGGRPVVSAVTGGKKMFEDAKLDAAPAQTVPAIGSTVGISVQRVGFIVPRLDFDEEDLVDWDVDFTPPPPPTRTLKLHMRRVGPAPIPDWGEE